MLAVYNDLKEMKLKSFVQTDVGLVRQSNQDSFFHDKDMGLFIVADGMGGHKGGRVASETAVKVFPETMKHLISQKENTQDGPIQWITASFEKTSETIYEKGRQNIKELEGMGTTLVCVFVYKNSFYVGNVGDSRCYLFTNNLLWQITEDHSLSEEQRRISLQLAEASFLKKNILTRSVGHKKSTQCDITEKSWKEGDLLLLCSDGLSNFVSGEQTREFCEQKSQDLKDLVSSCIDTAKSAGGSDNITLMAIKFEKS